MQTFSQTSSDGGDGNGFVAPEAMSQRVHLRLEGHLQLLQASQVAGHPQTDGMGLLDGRLEKRDGEQRSSPRAPPKTQPTPTNAVEPA